MSGETLINVLCSWPVLWSVVFFLLASLAVLAFGIRGRMEPRRGVCATCRHDLHDPLPERCAECGAELGAADGVDWGRPVPRGIVCLVGTLLAGLSLFALAIVGGVRSYASMVAFTPGSVTGLAPDTLRDRLLRAPLEDPIWNATWMAADFGELSVDQRLAAFEASAQRVVAELRGDVGFRSSSAAVVLGATLFGGQMVGGPGSEPLDAETLGDRLALLAGDLDVAIPQVVRAGEQIFVIPQAALERYGDYLMDIDLTLEVRRVAIDGVDVPRDGRPATRGFAPTGRPQLARFTAPQIEGPVRNADLEIEVAMTVAPKALGFMRPRLVGAGAAGGPPPVPSPIEITLPTLTRRIEIVGPDETLPRGVDDDESRRRVLDSITIDRAAIALDFDGVTRVAVAAISVTPVVGLGVSFEATMHVDADPPLAIRLGTVAAESREREAARHFGLRGMRSTARRQELGAWIPDDAAALGSEIRSVRIVLHPRMSTWLQQFGADRWFEGELVFDDVPLERLDIKSGGAASATGGGR